MAPKGKRPVGVSVLRLLSYMVILGRRVWAQSKEESAVVTISDWNSLSLEIVDIFYW